MKPLPGYFQKFTFTLLAFAVLTTTGVKQSLAQFSFFGFGQPGSSYSGGYSQNQQSNRAYNTRIAQRNYQARYNQVMRTPVNASAHYLAQDPPPVKVDLQPTPKIEQPGKIPAPKKAMPHPMPTEEVEAAPYPEVAGFGADHDCNGPGCEGGACNACDTCCDGPQLPWWIFKTPVFENFALYVGPHGFKGPVDQGVNGNFGFHYGFNMGIPISYQLGLGFQVGAQLNDSNLNGSTFGTDNRSQAFVTAGLFRRTDCGLQYGIVFDYLKDEYYADFEVHQTRFEVSYVTACGGEWGFSGAVNSKDQDERIQPNGQTFLQDYTFSSVDQYNFFYRRRFDNCGEGRLFAGFTNSKDGILGGDLEIPLTKRLAFQTSAAYLIPEEGKNNNGYVQENWGLALNLVWYPGCRARGQQCNPFKPLFDVGNNVNFMTTAAPAN